MPLPPIHAGHPIPSTQLGVCLSDNMPCFVFRILYPVFCIQLKLILDVCLSLPMFCTIKCVLLHSTDVLWFIQLNLRYSNKIYNLNIVNCFDTAELWRCHMVSVFFPEPVRMSQPSFTRRNVKDCVYYIRYTSNQKRIMPPLIIHCEGKVKIFPIEGVRDSFENFIYL